MLYRILGSIIRPFRICGFYLYTFLFRTPRARVIVKSEDDQILLVRNWGGERHWSLPGGGVKRREQPVEAAKRELHEEIGVLLPIDAFKYVATVRNRYEAPIFLVSMMKSTLPRRPHNPREIDDIRWFSVDALPTNVSPIVTLALNKLSKAQ